MGEQGLGPELRWAGREMRVSRPAPTHAQRPSHQTEAQKRRGAPRSVETGRLAAVGARR